MLADIDNACARITTHVMCMPIKLHVHASLHAFVECETTRSVVQSPETSVYHKKCRASASSCGALMVLFTMLHATSGAVCLRLTPYPWHDIKRCMLPTHTCMHCQHNLLVRCASVMLCLSADLCGPAHAVSRSSTADLGFDRIGPLIPAVCFCCNTAVGAARGTELPCSAFA
jgi:hypothetical protein